MLPRMGRYLVRRLLQMVPVLIGTTFIIYALVWALPGDPFAGKCGDRPCPESYITAMRDAYNLDDPLVISYAKYLASILTGDLGRNFAGVPVLDEILRAYPITVKLTLVALVFQIVVGISAGVIAGLRKERFVDTFILLSTLVLICVPVFILGFSLQYLLGVKWSIFPVTVSAEASIGDLILPGFVLGALAIAYVARLMRTSLVENRRADYIRTAVAKGLVPSRVIGVHLMRNSLIPVITWMGVYFGVLLGGAVVTEGIFNIPGVGGLVFRAVRTHEGATTTGVVTVLVLVFLTVNLLVDLLYAAIDPRIRYE